MFLLSTSRCTIRTLITASRGISTVSHGNLQYDWKKCQKSNIFLKCPVVDCKCLQFPTHSRRSYSSDNTKDEFVAPPPLNNITFAYILSHLYSMIFNRRVTKLAKLSSRSFFEGIVMAFMPVHNSLAVGRLEELEDMTTQGLFNKIKSGKGYKSPKVESIPQIESKDVLWVTLVQLKIYRDESSNLHNVEVLVRFCYAKDFRKKKPTAEDVKFANYRFLRTVGETENEVSDWRLMSILYFTLLYYFTLEERFRSPPPV